MRRKLGAFLMILGVIAVALSLALMSYNKYTDSKAGESANHYLELVKSEIKTRNDNTEGGLPAITPMVPIGVDKYVEPDLEYKEIDGHNYIGYISIADLGLDLPILKDYAYKSLDISPCRYDKGTTIKEMTIAGHNYWTHFRPLQEIKVGTSITFTDMTGKVHYYEVKDVEVLKPTQIDEMVSSGWALTLFTCTYARTTRLAVRCMSVKNN